MHHGSLQALIAPASCFAVRPDQVYAQIVDFTEYCGGMGQPVDDGPCRLSSLTRHLSNLELFLQARDAQAQGLQAAGAGSDRGVARWGLSARLAVLFASTFSSRSGAYRAFSDSPRL